LIIYFKVKLLEKCLPDDDIPGQKTPEQIEAKKLRIKHLLETSTHLTTYKQWVLKEKERVEQLHTTKASPLPQESSVDEVASVLEKNSDKREPTSEDMMITYQKKRSSSLLKAIKRIGSTSAIIVPEKEGDEGQCVGLLDCAVCLADFEPAEEVRELPCRHIFHVECIFEFVISLPLTA
jgi:hypothetical protein